MFYHFFRFNSSPLYSSNVFLPPHSNFSILLFSFTFKSGADTLMRPLVLSDTAVRFFDFSLRRGEKKKISRCALAHSTGLQLLRSIHVASKHYKPATFPIFFIFFFFFLFEWKRAPASLKMNTSDIHLGDLPPFASFYPSYLPSIVTFDKLDSILDIRNRRTWLIEWVLFVGTGQWGLYADGRGTRPLVVKGTRSRRRSQSRAPGESPRL